MTTHRGLAAMLAATLTLGACATPPPDSAEAVPAETTPLVFYTAGPGDVMLVADPCAAETCAAAAGAPLPGMTELVYLGMRSPTEAVFMRRQVAIHPGPLKPTEIPGLMVPDRAETPTGEGAFIPRVATRLPDGAEEIVMDPVAGVQLGADHVVVDISAVTPGRIVYVIDEV
ncbi:MAG: hypothetical protein ACFCUS_00810 [Rubrimonas sp.]|uniref:hypothetical protein n=1 Tax=Rubrimonas sp. TaxID=2036015 RepID=UPI002FDD1397